MSAFGGGTASIAAPSAGSPRPLLASEVDVDAPGFPVPVAAAPGPPSAFPPAST